MQGDYEFPETRKLGQSDTAQQRTCLLCTRIGADGYIAGRHRDVGEQVEDWVYIQPDHSAAIQGAGGYSIAAGDQL